MAKINHQRPSLRIRDNLRRESERDARRVHLPGGNPGGNPGPYAAADPEMPRLAAPDRTLVLAMLDATSSVFDCESAWLNTLPPLAAKGERRKKDTRRAELEAARSTHAEACDRIVGRMLEEALAGGDRPLMRWIEWFESRLLAERDISSLDVVFETGLKPALERRDATLLADAPPERPQASPAGDA